MATAKKYNELVLILDTNNGAVLSYVADVLEKSKSAILSQGRVKYSKAAVNKLPDRIKAKAEKNYSKVIANIEKRTNSSFEKVSKEDAKKVQKEIEVSQGTEQ